MTLRISPDLELPLDYVTKTCAILAQRRKGKTYTASVIAEELVAATIPWVALDPTGAWWGLRASADGQTAGLPVIVLGGQHGDAPLERGAGTVVADLVLDEPGYYVLDLSLLGTRAGEREFATAFADRLYRRKMQPGMDFPLHLFVDEADMFVPQEREATGDTVMLGAFQAIVRRGGLHGLGSTLISQRPALVNKSVLTQLDILILLRLIAGQDQEAVEKNYVRRAGGKEQQRELMDSLASLQIGEAWVWEPGAEPPLFERVRIRERRTFNSSATPKPGEKRVEPRVLADVDLDALRERMAATIERAKSDDPALLRRQIRELEQTVTTARKTIRDLEAAATPEAETVVERVEVPTFTDQERELLADVASVIGYAASVSSELLQAVTNATAKLAPPTARTPLAPARATPRPEPERRPPTRPPARPAPPSEGVTAPQQRILNALAALEQIGVPAPAKAQLALFAAASPKSSSYTNNLGALRTAALVDYPTGGRVELTEDGRAIADVGAAHTDEGELHRFVFGLVGPAKARILEALIPIHPDALSKQELADKVGVSATSSAFTNNLGNLRSLGLIDYPSAGLVKAQPVLFLNGDSG